MRYWLFLILLYAWNDVKANDCLATVQQLEQLPYDSFVLAFPLAAVPIEDVRTLEKCRAYMLSKGLRWNDFLLAMIEKKMAATDFDFEQLDDLKAILSIGEILSHSSHYLSDTIYCYMAGSDLIFGGIADTVQSLIRQDLLDVADFNVRYVVQRLLDNQYGIDIPTSNWVKLYNYCKEGRWDYIWHKFTSTYQREFLTAVLIGVLGLVGLGWIWRKRFPKFKPKTA
ncbi:MAG: hypothetical protein AAF960_02395 [Bacteroidota bacterium]